MSTLNIRVGSKVRVFVTPSRIRRGVACDSGKCAIALALLEQLGLKSVDVGFGNAIVTLPNGRKFVLKPVNVEHHDNFVTKFDLAKDGIANRYKRELPGRTNITYIVQHGIR